VANLIQRILFCSHALYASPDIIRVSKSRRLRGRACGTYAGREVVHRGFWWGNLTERRLLEEPGVDERIILKMGLPLVGWVH
jgi:hypothetical protein